MAKRIKIEFVTNPTPTVNLVFSIGYPPISNTIGVTIGVGGVTIGTTREDTASNLYDHYTALTVYSWINFTLASNIIYVDFTPEDDNNLSFPFIISSQSSILINEVVVPAVQPLQTALVRSTYSLRTIPGVLFDRAELQLFIWNGDINTPPSTPSYNLSKQVVQLGDLVINFDINTLLKEFIANSISNYTVSGIYESNYLDSCWCTYSIICYASDENIYQTSGSFFGLYGYGYFNQGFNPTLTSNVLISGNKHTYFIEEDSRVYFITDGLTSLMVNGVSQTVIADVDLNYQYLQSLNLNDYTAVSDKITLVFTYGITETRTIVFDVDCELKYDVINCVFINRYGVPQSIFFSKVNKHSEDTDGDEYLGLTSNFGVYDTTKHQYKEFNKNGRGKITCNTQNLNEYQNANLKELVYSETVWLIENGIINPVTLDKKSFDYKTSLVDKQIQYTIDFKYSFNAINQVY